MSAEVWKAIPLAPGYDVSDQGRIRSHRPWHGQPGPRMLSLAPKKPGSDYRVVRIHHGGAWRVRLVHQLVLEAFVGPRPADATDVRHLNDVKDDNRLVNLAWGTHSENMRDRVANGLHHYASRSHCKNGHEFTTATTRVVPSRTGSGTTRVCLTCKNAANRVYKARVRNAIETRELRAA